MLLMLLACTEPPTPFATRAVAEQVAAHGKERWLAEDLPLDWMQTVWAWGLWTLDPEDPYLRTWVDHNLDRFVGEEPKTFNSSDSLSPAQLASRLMVDEEYLAITDEGHRYLAEAPRLRNGAIEHWGPGSYFEDLDQVWIDSQFMFGMFLLAEYERTGDPAHLDLFVEQYLAFAELVADPGGLLFHAWDDVESRTIPQTADFWARGNSWVLIAGTEALRLSEPGGAAHAQLEPIVRAQAEALASWQAEDGLWYTVLNHPDEAGNYTETSGSALVALGLLRFEEEGPLREAGLRGVAGVLDEVDADGSVRGTSFGTNPGDYAYYTSVGTNSDIILGAGAVIALLAEAEGLPMPEESR